MAEHARREVIAEHGNRVYHLETRKVGSEVRSILREMIREGDFLSWSPFGGWSANLAFGGRRATEKEVEKCHAFALQAAAPAAEHRRFALLAAAECDEARPVCSCGERITEAEVACQGGRCDTCNHNQEDANNG